MDPMEMNSHFSDKPVLTPEDLEYLRSILIQLEGLAINIKEPLDPKVITLLTVIYDLINEQIVGDKKYKWYRSEDFEDKAFEDDADTETEDDNGPSVEDLESWLN